MLIQKRQGNQPKQKSSYDKEPSSLTLLILSFLLTEQTIKIYIHTLPIIKSIKELPNSRNVILRKFWLLLSICRSVPGGFKLLNSRLLILRQLNSWAVKEKDGSIRLRIKLRISYMIVLIIRITTYINKKLTTQHK